MSDDFSADGLGGGFDSCGRDPGRWRIGVVFRLHVRDEPASQLRVRHLHVFDLDTRGVDDSSTQLADRSGPSDVHRIFFVSQFCKRREQIFAKIDDIEFLAHFFSFVRLLICRLIAPMRLYNEEISG